MTADNEEEPGIDCKIEIVGPNMKPSTDHLEPLITTTADESADTARPPRGMTNQSTNHQALKVRPHIAKVEGVTD